MTDFEQKLASMQPRQLREIELPQKTTRPTSRNLWLRTLPLSAGLAGFLLGVIVTYIAISPQTPQTKTPVIGTGVVVVTPILDDTAIATLRRPMDLRQLASARTVKEPEKSIVPPETEFQYRTLLLKEIERQNRK